MNSALKRTFHLTFQLQLRPFHILYSRIDQSQAILQALTQLCVREFLSFNKISKSRYHDVFEKKVYTHNLSVQVHTYVAYTSFQVHLSNNSQGMLI